MKRIFSKSQVTTKANIIIILVILAVYIASALIIATLPKSGGMELLLPAITLSLVLRVAAIASVVVAITGLVAAFREVYKPAKVALYVLVLLVITSLLIVLRFFELV